MKEASIMMRYLFLFLLALGAGFVFSATAFAQCKPNQTVLTIQTSAVDALKTAGKDARLAYALVRPNGTALSFDDFGKLRAGENVCLPNETQFDEKKFEALKQHDLQRLAKAEKNSTSGIKLRSKKLAATTKNSARSSGHVVSNKALNTTHVSNVKVVRRTAPVTEDEQKKSAPLVTTQTFKNGQGTRIVTSWKGEMEWDEKPQPISFVLLRNGTLIPTARFRIARMPNPEVATIVLNSEDTHTALITPKAPGRTSFIVTSGDAALEVPIIFKQKAGPPIEFRQNAANLFLKDTCLVFDKVGEIIRVRFIVTGNPQNQELKFFPNPADALEIKVEGDTIVWKALKPVQYFQVWVQVGDDPKTAVVVTGKTGS